MLPGLISYDQQITPALIYELVHNIPDQWSCGLRRIAFNLYCEMRWG